MDVLNYLRFLLRPLLRVVLLHWKVVTPPLTSMVATPDDRYLGHHRCHADADGPNRASFAAWRLGALPGPMLASRLWTGADGGDHWMTTDAAKTTTRTVAAGAKREKCIPHITVRPLGAVWRGLTGSWSALCGRSCLPCRSRPLAGWFLRTRSGPVRRSPF